MSKQILILPGDGIGQEVTASMMEVLNYLILEQSLDFKIEERTVGGCSYEEFGKPLTDETLSVAKQSDAILFGA
ncbi:isocitrate/isopropylmalate family dehydrogenase, partial [Gammaproteobacteria bacterium]|nr:isocitrate/isopropylmalate family dehydrogenase [Gammaproteobacteria bacterium]